MTPPDGYEVAYRDLGADAGPFALMFIRQAAADARYVWVWNTSPNAS